MYYLLYVIMMGSLVGPITVVDVYPDAHECRVQSNLLSMSIYTPSYINKDDYDVYLFCTDKKPEQIVDERTGTLLIEIHTKEPVEKTFL